MTTTQVLYKELSDIDQQISKLTHKRREIQRKIDKAEVEEEVRKTGKDSSDVRVCPNCKQIDTYRYGWSHERDICGMGGGGYTCR